MKKDNDIGTPFGMVDDNHWPVTCSQTESVEARWFQECFKARQGLYLRNELLTHIQKLTLLHNEMSIWIYPCGVGGTVAAVDITVR